MKLIAFHRLGENRGSPRVWLESQRLATLGFAVGSPFVVEARTRGVRLRINDLGTHRVAKRRAAGGLRPIIDVANRTLLASLAPWPEIRIEATAGLINITPSARGFAIQRRLLARPPFRALEVFAGGGTLSAAIASHCDFRLVAGVEIEPRFADVWQAAHREAVLIQADIRRIHPSEYPRHELLVAAIPCTSHSLLGRAKKSLRGKPELGESGDLFLCISALVATHLPLACVFENVPTFRTPLAGQTLTHHLRQLGYYVYETMLDPHNEWDEPQDRRRWLMVATLQPGFYLKAPMVPFAGDLSRFIDPPSACDRPDVERIAGSIAALIRHRDTARSVMALVSPPSLKRLPGCQRLCVPITKLMLGRSSRRFLVLAYSASTRLSGSWVAPSIANITQRRLRFLGKVPKHEFSGACLLNFPLSCNDLTRRSESSLKNRRP